MSTSALRAPELKLVRPEKKPETPRQSDEKAQPIVTTRKRWKAVLREIFEGHEEYLGLTPD